MLSAARVEWWSWWSTVSKSAESFSRIRIEEREYIVTDWSISVRDQWRFEKVIVWGGELFKCCTFQGFGEECEQRDWPIILDRKRVQSLFQVMHRHGGYEWEYAKCDFNKNVSLDGQNGLFKSFNVLVVINKSSWSHWEWHVGIKAIVWLSRCALFCAEFRDSVVRLKSPVSLFCLVLNKIFKIKNVFKIFIYCNWPLDSPNT